MENSEIVVAELEPTPGNWFRKQSLLIDMFKSDLAQIHCNAELDEFPFNVKLNKSLGSGHHGTVYSACSDENCERLYAIKRQNVYEHTNVDTDIENLTSVANFLNKLFTSGISPNFSYTYIILYCPFSKPTRLVNDKDWELFRNEYHFAKTKSGWTDEKIDKTLQAIFASRYPTTLGNIFIITEMGGPTLHDFFGNYLDIEVQTSLYFQMVQASYCLLTFGYTNNDFHDENMVVQEIEADGYYEYVMAGNVFYVPTFGYRVVFIDYEYINKEPTYQQIAGLPDNTPQENINEALLFVYTIREDWIQKAPFDIIPKVVAGDVLEPKLSEEELNSAFAYLKKKYSSIPKYGISLGRFEI